MAVSSELLEILACPACHATVTLEGDEIVCGGCSRRYPVKDDIPVMLIDEGDKWVNTAETDLPVPPPAK